MDKTFHSGIIYDTTAIHMSIPVVWQLHHLSCFFLILSDEWKLHLVSPEVISVTLRVLIGTFQKTRHREHSREADDLEL